MKNEHGTRMQVARGNLERTQFVPDPDAPAARPLADGEARLAISSFALTANNITYAAFGESMHYWEFFPAADVTWGCIPVWGFADVAESRAPGVVAGQRVYGYFPMGTHLVVQPARASAAGFTDAAPHRAGLPAIYNHYDCCAADPGYDPAQEAQQAILRPLFTTSFLIDDFLADNEFFGARRAVLSSASSKTAYGTAFCLAQRHERPALVGLTSPTNSAFTRSLGCYDQVVEYDALTSVDADLPTVYVDFAGNATLRQAVHALFASSLVYSCAVGGTHWAESRGSTEVAGPRPVLFFAPAQARKRAARPPEGWGPAGLQQRVGIAWSSFMRRVNDPDDPWVSIETHAGAPNVERAYRNLLAGNVDARAGLMLSF